MPRGRPKGSPGGPGRKPLPLDQRKPNKRRGDKPLTCCTTIWRLDPSKPQVTAPLRLPSAGDCSYPGLVWDAERQEVLIVWYSQHERDTSIVGMPHAADIYLGRLTVEEA